MEIVKLCFNCLAHHKSSQCQSKNHCRNCRRKHHTSLCTGTDSQMSSNQPPMTTVVSPPTSESTSQSPEVHNTAVTTVSSTSQQPIIHSNNRNLCLQKTAVANVSTSNRQTEVNILFDKGSQRSFISQSLANSLQLQPFKKEKIQLSAFASRTSSPQQLETASINLETRTGTKLQLSVLIMPTIAAPLQNAIQSQITQLPYLQDLHLLTQLPLRINLNSHC